MAGAAPAFPHLWMARWRGCRLGQLLMAGKTQAGRPLAQRAAAHQAVGTVAGVAVPLGHGPVRPAVEQAASHVWMAVEAALADGWRFLPSSGWRRGGPFLRYTAGNEQQGGDKEGELCQGMAAHGYSRHRSTPSARQRATISSATRRVSSVTVCTAPKCRSLRYSPPLRRW